MSLLRVSIRTTGRLARQRGAITGPLWTPRLKGSKSERELLTRQKISLEEVGALFAGSGRDSTKRAPAFSRQRDYQASYGRCHNCNARTIGLMTFYGDKDWSPDLSLDNPVRAIVGQIREVFGVVAVYLCWDCIERARGHGDASEATTQSQDQPDRATDPRHEQDQLLLFNL